MENAKSGSRRVVWVCGVMLLGAAPVFAQEATGGKEGKPGAMQCCEMMEKGMKGAMQMEGKEMQGMMGQMHMMHGQMAKMRREMLHAQQEQLTALREHAKTMDGITDQQQLLGEMKKHQQMTDALLGTIVEQREKMHARMEEEHEGHPMGPRYQATPADSALDILKKRYARGEIGKEEYEEKKKDLKEE